MLLSLMALSMVLPSEMQTRRRLFHEEFLSELSSYISHFKEVGTWPDGAPKYHVVFHSYVVGKELECECIRDVNVSDQFRRENNFGDNERIVQIFMPDEE